MVNESRDVPAKRPLHRSPRGTALSRAVLGVLLSALSLVVVGSSSVAGATTPTRVWSDQEVAAALNIGSGSFGGIGGVSCPTSSFCATGGAYKDSAGKYQAFVSTWNGSTWNDQEVAAALNVGGNAYVYAVSCSSATFCVAGGYYRDSANRYQSFVSTWNGSTWTSQEIAGALNLGGSSWAQAVSCVSPTFCAVGGFYYDSAGNSQPYVATWNGTAWTSQEVAASGAGSIAEVYSVSCVSATFCVAGGAFQPSGSAHQSFVATWNGTTWSTQEVAANLNAGGSSQVYSVSCSSATFCVAGGQYKDSAGHYQSFVSTWNGTTWSDQEIAGALNVGNYSELNSVSCSSATSCVAGGYYYNTPGTSQSFVSTWNGSSWSDQEIAANLNAGGSSQVNSVSCSSATFCVAGGYYYDSANHYQSFVSTWNGSTWSDQELAGALNAAGDSQVASVSCTTSTFCAAGGRYAAAVGNYQSFVSVSRVPVSLSSVTISGTPAVGQTVTAVSGGVSGVPAPTESYQWLANGVAIPGATSSTLTLTPANYGQQVSVTVTETNSLGALSLTSSGVTVAGIAPTITSATLTGTPTVGQILSAHSGGVSGVPAPTESYQWLANGVAIPGATSSTYVLQPKNVLEKLSVTITETSPAGRVSLTSSPSLPVAPRYGALSTPLSHLFRGSSTQLHLSKSTLSQLERVALSLRATGSRLLLLDHVTYEATKDSSLLRALALQLGKKRMRVLVRELVTLAHREGVTLHVTTKVLAHSLKGLTPSARRLWTSVGLEK